MGLLLLQQGDKLEQWLILTKCLCFIVTCPLSGTEALLHLPSAESGWGRIGLFREPHLKQLSFCLWQLCIIPSSPAQRKFLTPENRFIFFPSLDTWHTIQGFIIAMTHLNREVNSWTSSLPICDHIASHCNCSNCDTKQVFGVFRVFLVTLSIWNKVKRQRHTVLWPVTITEVWFVDRNWSVCHSFESAPLESSD